VSWKTVKYDGQVNFSAFTCDQPVLNDYLHQKAVKEHESDICKLYFLVNDQNEVGGYYVVSNSSIRRQDLPTAKARRNLPGYPLGSVHIGRLARHKDMVGQKLGDWLIHSAFEVAAKSSDITAAHVLTVDAKDLRAETYYAKHGFENLIADPAKTTEYPKALYMKMKDVRFILSGIQTNVGS